MINNSLIAKMEHEWDKRGYYQVGANKFYSKAQAILHLQKTGQSMNFVFNDAEFGTADWKQEPVDSIQEIYRKRAQQLRDKYDHLVLSYSSGSDSSNILHAFINNGIKLDEIFCYGPFKTSQGHNKPLTQDSENNFREIDLVALPYLRELSKKHKFKITLYDWTDDVANGFKSADWVWNETQSRLSPSIVARNRLHNARSHLNLVDKGQRVAFIFGIDKPRVILKDGSYYTAFLDLTLNMGVGPGACVTGSEWETDEYFYWTPDMPEIVIKQGHMIKNFIEAHSEMRNLVLDADQGAWHEAYSTQYYHLVKTLLYPGFNPGIWQTKKISSLTYTEHDGWFINSHGLEAKKHWLAGLHDLQQTLDSKWFIQGTVNKGFVGSWSKWYKIG